MKQAAFSKLQEQEGMREKTKKNTIDGGDFDFSSGSYTFSGGKCQHDEQSEEREEESGSGVK